MVKRDTEQAQEAHSRRVRHVISTVLYQEQLGRGNWFTHEWSTTMTTTMHDLSLVQT